MMILRGDRTGGSSQSFGVGLIVLAITLFSAVLVQAQEAQAADPYEEIKPIVDEAKKLGAKGQLPLAWRNLDEQIRFCREDGCTEGQWETVRNEALRLRNMAGFVHEMRRKRSGMEAMLGRFDQALMEMGELFGVAPDALLSGTPAANDLLEKLNRVNLRRQAVIDSLTINNRYLSETVASRVVAQDSIITRLTVEVSSLRQQLWEMELRAGVAEADRSAAETLLERKKQKEAAIASIKSSIGPGAGEVLLTPDGDILLRITGIAFGVGSASLRSGQEVVVQRVASAVELFPGSTVEVSGHTDDTGTRQANLRLSLRRAETVARLLEEQLGLEQGAIATQGFGPDRPVALNDSDQGRARNRRIDVVIKPVE
jgi:outer membrane protein OmpA-like peptidoglycan-associated protein